MSIRKTLIKTIISGILVILGCGEDKPTKLQNRHIDLNNDGIYESTIQNIAEGSYTITINAIGSEDYNFMSYQLTINAITPAAPDFMWLILLLSGGVVGIVLVFSLYQFHFKYPPMVRKIRKLRKRIRKEKNTKPILLKKRNEIKDSKFQSQVDIIGFESQLPEKKIEK